MKETNVEIELTAIRAITEALKPLERDTRQRVLNYVIQLLGLSTPTTTLEDPDNVFGQKLKQSPPIPPHMTDQSLIDIRSLKEKKKPSTDIEMATLIAYYMKHAAPEGERKEEIGTEDIEKYFIQAGYPLPSEKRFTLTNAKKAGYLESTTRGKYKLNSVGYNLVAHNMPRTDTAGLPKIKKRVSRKSIKASKRVKRSKK